MSERPAHPDRMTASLADYLKEDIDGSPLALSCSVLEPLN